MCSSSSPRLGSGHSSTGRRPALAPQRSTSWPRSSSTYAQGTTTDVLLDVMQLVACAQRRVGGEVGERKRREAEQLRELLVGARAPG